MTTDYSAGPSTGDVAGYMIHVGVTPRWAVCLQGGPYIGLVAVTRDEVETLAIAMARKLGRAAWLEDAPGRWQQVAGPRKSGGFEVPGKPSRRRADRRPD